MHGVLDASMRIPDLVRIAAATGVAVEVVLAPTDAADATPLAVEDLLLDAVVVPEVAVRAEVGTEDLVAVGTLPARRLRPETPLADHLSDASPVNLVGPQPTTVLPLVVAMAAPENFSAAWCDNSAFAPIMPAPLSCAP
mmetsp:Transcript_99532/g.187121  ORF Transcript_99532/g.187121 Transcript_99532/m.187121 type:complete len:139 (+) Transcript_99532:526-942(+)